MPNIEKSVGARDFRPQKKEQLKNYAEKLKNLMGKISEKTNREIKERYGLYTFLNPDCTISMEGYADSWGGIYHEQKIEDQKKEIVALELKFSEADSPAVQERYRSTCGIQSQEGIVKRWKENKEKSKSGQMEMAITVLLCKMLKDNFLVVRTATYDDYFQGADNIILNKRTGESICAFDAFHEGEQGDLTVMKKFKTKRIAEKGGAEISYGMKLKDGKMARSKMKNVPVFSLGLDSKELMELLENMNFDLEAPTTEMECEIFSKLRTSLSQQRDRLIASPGTSAEVKKKLVAFKTSLAMMERIGAKVH
jgi:hypothetical protein